MARFHPPGECPNCGADVPRGAASCRECGACPQTGWSDDTAIDGLDLPEDSDPRATPDPTGDPARGRAEPGRGVPVALVLAVAAILAVVLLLRR